jgi:hypothetical protein
MKIQYFDSVEDYLFVDFIDYYSYVDIDYYYYYYFAYHYFDYYYLMSELLPLDFRLNYYNLVLLIMDNNSDENLGVTVPT